MSGDATLTLAHVLEFVSEQSVVRDGLRGRCGTLISCTHTRHPNASQNTPKARSGRPDVGVRDGRAGGRTDSWMSERYLPVELSKLDE